MTERQYVAVQFNPWDRRTYTYHNDGAPLAPGDTAIVVTDRGETEVIVASIVNNAPEFDTKAIARRGEAESEEVEQ